MRDFCPGGLHLEVPRPAWDGRDAQPPPLALRGDPAVVMFSADSGAGQEEFELRLQVARVFDSGLGVAFVDPNPAAFRALQQLAAHVQEKGGVATPATMEAIRSACRVALADHVEPLLETMMRDIGGPLVQAASDAGSNAGQSRYFDAISLLDGSRKAIATEVLAAMHDRIADFGTAGAMPHRAVVDETTGGEMTDELSLVNVDEFEDLLIVAEIVTAADALCEAPLKELEQRLGGACGAPLTREQNPVSAAALCHPFRDAISRFALHRDARLVIYRELRQQVVPALATLYNDINTELERIGVRPPPKQRKKLPRAQNPSPEPEPTPIGDGPAEGPVEAPDSVADAGADAGAVGGLPTAGANVSPAAATQGAQAAGPPGSLQAGTQGAFAGSAAGAVPVGSPGVMPGDATGAAPPHAIGPLLARATGAAGAPMGWPTAGAPGAPAGEVRANGLLAVPGSSRGGAFGTARTLLGLQRRLAVPAGQVVSGEPLADAAPTFSGEQVVDALDALQRDGFGSVPEDATRGLLAALNALLAGGSAGGAQHALASSQADPIALMDRLFGAMQKDTLLCEATIERINSLQPVVHKANLLEPGFFDEENHPARRALDALGRLDAAIDDNRAVSDESVPALVDSILGVTLKAVDQDLEPIRAAADSLEDLSADIQEAYERNVADVVAAREAQEAFLRSRQKSSHEGGRTDASSKTQSLEWSVWLNRVRRLCIGDTLLVSDPGASPRRLTVAWIGENHEMLLLVNSRGLKADSPILQELAMRMRRGTATLLSRTQQPLVTRALSAALAGMHGGIEHSATHDRVTGLAKFKHFEGEVSRALTRAVQDHLEHVLLHLSLDYYASLQEQGGVEAADSLARAATETLVSSQRKGCPVASFGDGALAVLLENCSGEDGATTAERLCEALAETTIECDAGSFSAAASIGLALINKRTPDTGSLFAGARAAAQVANAAGGSHVEVAQLDDESKIGVGPMMAWVPLLNRTLRGARPRFRWQRIRPLHDDADAAPFFELLLDLRDEDGEPVPPDKLLQTAVYYNHMPDLDRRIIRGALACMAANADRLAELGACAINLADETLADERLVVYVVDELLASGVPPSKVCFEVSEAAALAHRATLEDLMFTLREYGCQFTLVDVGGGGSAYEHLEDLPVDFIKIGGIFVRDIATSVEDLAVVQSIHELGRFLGKRTIAECVEDEQTLTVLREMGVDFAQGYGVDRPHHIDDDTVIADGESPSQNVHTAP